MQTVVSVGKKWIENNIFILFKFLFKNKNKKIKLTEKRKVGKGN